jgi:hypothetical protein
MAASQGGIVGVEDERPTPYRRIAETPVAAIGLGGKSLRG